MKFSKEICPEHKPMSKVMSYVEHEKWGMDMAQKGYKQYQCPKCGRWLFKRELK